MPELPDVETYKRYLESAALHKEIIGVAVADKRILRGVSASALRQALVDRQFTETWRHGKYLFCPRRQRCLAGSAFRNDG